MKRSLLSVAAIAAATSGHSAEVTGGEVRLAYSQFTSEQAGETLNNTTLDSAIEIGFNKSFATQLDLGVNQFGASDLSGHNAVVHGIVHSSETLSFGGFFGQDKLESASREFLGAEIGFEGTRFDVEGYYLANVDDGTRFSVYGVTGNYHFNDRFALTGGVENGDISGGSSLSRYAVGVRYNVGNNVALTADIGASQADAFGASDTETFVGVGAELTFGAERGATFGKRSLFSLIPGL